MERNLLLFGLWDGKILHAVVDHISAGQGDQSQKNFPSSRCLPPEIIFHVYPK